MHSGLYIKQHLLEYFAKNNRSGPDMTVGTSFRPDITCYYFLKYSEILSWWKGGSCTEDVSFTLLNITEEMLMRKSRRNNPFANFLLHLPSLVGHIQGETRFATTPKISEGGKYAESRGRSITYNFCCGNSTGSDKQTWQS